MISRTLEPSVAILADLYQVRSLLTMIISIYLTYIVNCSISLEPQGQDWEYFAFKPTVISRLVHLSDEEMGSTYELFIMVKILNHRKILFDGLGCQPNPEHDEISKQVLNSEWNGEPEYRTGDILIKHPTKTGYYKVLGRKGDKVMLSSGEVVRDSTFLLTFHLVYSGS
jgi:hypothetical protein